jgi:hypothetical protein
MHYITSENKAEWWDKAALKKGDEGILSEEVTLRWLSE